jgi:hypothetical protein
MDLKNGKVFTTKFVGTGPSSYEKSIYRAAVSQRLRNTALEYVIRRLHVNQDGLKLNGYVSAFGLYIYIYIYG